jgi:hypothetical protein
MQLKNLWLMQLANANVGALSVFFLMLVPNRVTTGVVLLMFTATKPRRSLAIPTVL